MLFSISKLCCFWGHHQLIILYKSWTTEVWLFYLQFRSYRQTNEHFVSTVPSQRNVCLQMDFLSFFSSFSSFSVSFSSTLLTSWCKDDIWNHCYYHTQKVPYQVVWVGRGVSMSTGLAPAQFLATVQFHVPVQLQVTQSCRKWLTLVLQTSGGLWSVEGGLQCNSWH